MRLLILETARKGVLRLGLQPGGRVQARDCARRLSVSGKVQAWLGTQGRGAL